LLVDEIYSLDLRNFRIKKSFGTALKLYSRNFWADASTYAKLVLLTYVAIQDPAWMGRFRRGDHHHGENQPTANRQVESQENDAPSVADKDWLLDRLIRR
ncbi:MAG: hypothetical protein N2C14_32980, partial [Planctomycetales bacterium]